MAKVIQLLVVNKNILDLKRTDAVLSISGQKVSDLNHMRIYVHVYHYLKGLKLASTKFCVQAIFTENKCI